MSTPQYLLTIVMASHNRSNYAMAAIRSVLAISDPHLQLVVHDSSDGRELQEFSGAISDSRLLYRHAGQRVSMTENHNLAMNLAEGKYVCLIGDDDSVSHEIMEFVRWADRNHIEAVTPRVLFTYSWPDFATRLFGTSHAGKLYMAAYSAHKQMLDSREALATSLAGACQGTDNLPKLYHGIALRKIFTDAKRDAGDYLFGVSPDVSAAITIAHYARGFLSIDYPLTIPGASGNSNTGRSALNRHKGNLEDDPHIKPYRDLVWPPLIPHFFSVETVWAQAALATLAAHKMDDEIHQFGFIKLYALCLSKHWEYRNKTIKSFNALLTQRKLNRISGWLQLGIAVAGVWMVRINYLVKRLFRPTASAGKDVVADLADIEAATRAVRDRLNHIKSVTSTDL